MRAPASVAALVSLASLLGGAAQAADTASIVASQCIACHGEGGNSVVPMFPRLAGQHAEYLDKQLKDFLAGKRKNDVMAPALAQIKEGDVAGLAAYYAAQKPTPIKPDNDKLLAAGKAMYDDGNTQSGVPACVGCHQAEGAGNERYPRLAAQFPSYAAAQIKAFKSGARNNDRAKVMRAVAERMTDDEIAAVSEYLASLP
ncbi:MAG: cytochrome c4 [Proteobacteria bacterium]|nr:cytochrome c4 [Pseudomonadota bacterium]